MDKVIKMKIYNIYQSGTRLYIDEKENPDNKIVCNKFESEQITLRLISDGTLPPRLYWALRNPKLSQKYFILPLVNDNELIVGTDISATPGLWDMILIGTPDDYIIEGADIDQSKLTYVSDPFSRLFVRDNYLKELDFEEQCSPTFKVFYDDILFQLSKKANGEDIPTKVSELENDSRYITEETIEDLIDLPISETEENGVVVFDVNEAENEYAFATGKKTKSLGQGSFTGGVYNQTGSMAFTIINVDTTAKTYTLDSTEGLEIGDVYSAHILYDDNSSSQGENYGKITAINGNIVTVDHIFCEKTFTTSASYLDRNSLDTERNTFRIISKPNVGTRKLGYGATSFGGGNKSLLKGSFSAGQYNEVYGSNGIGLGNGNKVGYNGYGEGYHTYCIGSWSHTEGKFVIAMGQFDHAEGLGDTELPDNITIHSSIKEIIEEWAINKFHLAKGDICHLEGLNCLALADRCHNEGTDTISLGLCNHAEGCNVVTYGAYAHGQGYSPVNACIELDIFSMTKEEILNEWLSRSNKKKFALGYGKASDISGEACLALDDYSSARNYQCVARFVADASGWSTRALGDASHTQGRDTEARKAYSDASGLSTIANAECQHVGGKYNVVDEDGDYLEIIGNGTSNSKRSNARTLDKDGNAWFAGDVYANNNKLATTDMVKEAFDFANFASVDASDALTQSEEALIIAKGANKALSYSNYQTMITDLCDEGSDNYYGLIVGQNIMIVTLEVPDLWVSEVSNEYIGYNYTTDENFVADLTENGTVQVGCYVLSPLETQKVDLSDCVKNTDYPTATTSGVVKVNNTLAYGIYLAENGMLMLKPATTAQIDVRNPNNTERSPITTSNVDYAVQQALIDSKVEWTDEQKQLARTLLGATNLNAHQNYGINTNATGLMMIAEATNTEIDNKSTKYKPITPNNVDYAVMKALTDCKNYEWTDEEKASALELLGGVASSLVSSAAKKKTIVLRGSSGAIYIGEPTQNSHATTKKYVDTITKQYADKSAPFISKYGVTTYEELLEAYRANKTLLVRVLKDESNSELTGGDASEIVACLSRVDGLGVQMKNGDYGFVSSEDNLATFSLRNLESFDKTLLSMKVKFEGGGYQTRIDVFGTGAWTGLSVYEENGNLIIKDFYGMTATDFYQALTPDVAGVESFLDNEFLLQLKFDYNTSNTIGGLGVYINGKLYNDETFSFTGMKSFGNCMSLYREVAESVITVNSVNTEDENVVTLDEYQIVTISDFIEGIEKESPTFTFTADENGVVRYYKMNADKEWIFWNYKYANNIDNHDKQILGLVNAVNDMKNNTDIYNSFRGGFRNTAGSLSIKAPGIYFVLQGGENNKTIKITQPDDVVEITKNAFIILAYDNGLGTVFGITGISLTSLNPISTGSYQLWSEDGTYHTEISYPATTMISYLGNSNVDVGEWN